jgi:hypothetical protein
MRHARRTGRLTFAILVTLGVRGGEAQTADLAAEVKATAGVILSGDRPGEIPEALVRLVTLASRIAAEGKLPEAVRTKLEAARAGARPEGLLGEKSQASLREAYALLNEGRPFAMPKGLDGLDALMAHGRKQVDRSVTALGKAKPAEAARELVGFILLVITPMEQDAAAGS